MASGATTGEKLVEDTVCALEAMAAHLTAPDDQQLQILGACIQDMLVSYREVLGYAKKRRLLASFTSAQIGRIFRVVIVFATFFSLVSSKLTTVGEGRQWGSHVFSEKEFADLGFDRFAAPASETAVAFLLGDTAADLLEAMRALKIRSSPGPHFATTTRVRNAVLQVLAVFPGSALGDPLNIEAWDHDHVQTELGIDRPALDKLVSERRILTVQTWAGATRFPAFQIDLVNKRVMPTIEHTSVNVSDDFKGWPLAIWLDHNKTQNADFFEESLSNYGLWQPAWTLPPTNVYQNVKGNPVEPFMVTQPLFRVAWTGHGPFWFSTIPASAPNGGRAGRFDVSSTSTTGLGTMYVSEGQPGAWREVLERVPTITLRNLLGRTLWELRFRQHPELGTVLKTLGLATERRRSETQSVAERLAQRAAKGEMQGFEYYLRTGEQQIGIALFGPAGATLPESAELGVWSAESRAELDSDGLWDYLTARRKDEPNNPILLRRFPTEITLPKRA